MQGPEREGDGPLTSERETFERIGYTRCEAEVAERDLAALKQRRERLRGEIDAVLAENGALERELLQKLAEWRRLDDAQQRIEEVMPQLRAITGSLTYRYVAALLRGVNRVRRWLHLSPPAS